MVVAERNAIQDVVTGLVNAGAAVTAVRIDAAAGLETGHFAELYASVDAVYADIVADLFDTYLRLGGEGGMVRRRSTTQAIALSLVAFMECAVEHSERHRAVLLPRLTHPDLVIARFGHARLADLPSMYAQRWLEDISRTQNTTWNTPVPVLAQFVVSTLDGLFTDMITTRDITGGNELLTLFAYYLADHARRIRGPVTPTSTA